MTHLCNNFGTEREGMRALLQWVVEQSRGIDIPLCLYDIFCLYNIAHVCMILYGMLFEMSYCLFVAFLNYHYACH